MGSNTEITAVHMTVVGASEHDARRAAEKMYGGQLSWVLTQLGDWIGTDNEGVEVAVIKLDVWRMPEKKPSAV